jgi:putative ABC transport system permease protein
VAVSYPNFLDWRAQSSSFDAMAAYAGGRETVLGGHAPVFADVYLVTDGFFRVLATEPAIGRTFSAEEARPGGVPAVVVSYGFWERTLDGNRDLAALRVEIAGLACRVVGVMPRAFAFPASADVWAPKELIPDDTSRSGHNFAVIARAKPAVPVAQADAEMDAIARQLKAKYGSDDDAQSVTVMPLHEALTGGTREALLTLLGAVGLVLLIACVNVASTLLARGEERRKELAIRAALGAGRVRLVRQLLTENLLLALAGAAGGLLIAAWLVRWLLAVNPAALPRPDAIGIDMPVLGFTLVLAVVTPLLFGAFPSMQISRTELRDAMAEGGRASATPMRGRVRSVLIAAEVAVALLLLVGAALLVRSFWNVLAVDAGFAGRDVMTVEMVLPGTRYPDAARSAAFYRDLLPRIRAIPGVQAAGAISSFPLSGDDPDGGFVFEGETGAGHDSHVAGYRVVSGDYFAAMGIPLLQGRPITDSDAAGGEIVVVVNQDFVRKHLGGRDAIGRRFRYFGMDSLNEPWMTIVGVVGNVRHASLVREPVPEAYVSYLQRPLRTRYTMTLAVRAAQPSLAAGIASAVRERVRAMDADAPMEFSTLDARIGQSVADRRFTMMVLGAFAGIALLLAAVGIYGVLAYSVAQRTQEIGIRMALGADPRSVISLMLRSALAPVGAGVAVGVAGSLLTSRALRSFLFGVRPTDPAALVVAVAILVAVAWLASYIPARRATRVDPLIALR